MFPKYENCDKYSYFNIMVAGDAIWHGLRLKIFVHNLLIDTRQIFRYGLKRKKGDCK